MNPYELGRIAGNLEARVYVWDPGRPATFADRVVEYARRRRRGAGRWEAFQWARWLVKVPDEDWIK